MTKKIKVWNSYVDGLYKPMPQYIKFRQCGLTLFTSYYSALQELHRIKKIV